MNTKLSLFLLILASSCNQNPLGSNVNIGSNFYPGLLAPPKIESLSPIQGPNIGGTNVMIRGSGFTKTSKVKIGDKDCPRTDFISYTQLVCLTPDHSLGAKDVKVINSDEQQSILSGSFLYIQNIASIPGMEISSGGSLSLGVTVKMHSSIGSPVKEQTLEGETMTMQVGVGGIILNDN